MLSSLLLKALVLSQQLLAFEAVSHGLPTKIEMLMLMLRPLQAQVTCLARHCCVRLPARASCP